MDSSDSDIPLLEEEVKQWRPGISAFQDIELYVFILHNPTGLLLSQHFEMAQHHQ